MGCRINKKDIGHYVQVSLEGEREPGALKENYVLYGILRKNDCGLVFLQPGVLLKVERIGDNIRFTKGNKKCIMGLNENKARYILKKDVWSVNRFESISFRKLYGLRMSELPSLNLVGQT